MEFGLIGHPLGHSFSPEIHRRIGGYSYELRDLMPEELSNFMKERDFRAVNVTIPYKRAVIPMLDRISPEAERIGAVNTVVNRGGALTGYNTDYEGMKYLLARAGIGPAGKKVLILGTGGTSETARAVMTDLGAAEILRVSRHGKGPGIVSYREAAEKHRDALILINTTPVGMYPEDETIPLDLSDFPALEGIADAVYHPLRTALVLAGRERGIPSAGGLSMLVAQAVTASALFFGKEPEDGATDRILKQLLQEKENIVLTGMPTCGKTATGRLLAKRTGRQFMDTDEMIAKRTGFSPAELIRSRGESSFRALERDAVAEAAKETGIVLATGGGAAMNAENVRALKRNGRLFFLDRPPALLTASADRPLSSDAERLAKLYRQRYGIYLAAADERIEADGSPAETAEKVWEAFVK